MQNSPTYKTIIETDLININKIFNSSPNYIEIDIKLIKKFSLPVNNPKNKPKKKKNLLLELEKKKELPKLDLNQKNSKSKLIISYTSDKSTNYRNLRKIFKAMKGYNCDIVKFVVNPQNDSQNIDLIRLLVSKVNKDRLALEVLGQYAEFWKVNGELLGNANYKNDLVNHLVM